MDEIIRLVGIVQAHGHEVWIGGGASTTAVSELENAMGVALPPTFKSFLTTYGALGVYDNFLSGIINDEPLATECGCIYGDTLTLRDRGDDVPTSLWVIRVHADGAYCIDTSRPTENGEFAVVNYEFHSNQHKDILARSYPEFVCKWFLEGRATDTV